MISVNIKASIIFLYTSNKQLESKIKFKKLYHIQYHQTYEIYRYKYNNINISSTFWKLHYIIESNV